MEDEIYHRLLAVHAGAVDSRESPNQRASFQLCYDTNIISNCPNHTMSNTKEYATSPHEPTIPIKEFTVSFPQTELDDLNALLRQAVKRPPRETYENSYSKLNLGVSREWLMYATKYWSESFKWSVKQ